MDDRLTHMTRTNQAGQTGGNAVATKRVDFAYNALGQFTVIDRYQNTGGSNLVAQTTFAYDVLNRLTGLDHVQGATTLGGYDYTYDQMSRITSINSTVEGLSSFTHDKTSQLSVADHATPRVDETYSYDANGNRTMSGYATAANNRTTSDGTYTYQYDDEGNRVRRTKTSDGTYEEYEWDHRNRLTKVTFKNSSGTVLKTIEHSYDVHNRWVRRHTDTDGPGPAAAVDTFFAFDGAQPILQFAGAAASTLAHRYLFGPAVDQVLADEAVPSLNQPGNILWPLADHLGTLRDLADQDESTFATAVTNHRTYNAYGHLTAETNPAVDLAFGFTGKILDEDTQLQNNWHRWYAPTLGRWLSEDPLGFEAGDANIVRYVGNRPNDATDPSGLQPPDSNWASWANMPLPRPTPPNTLLVFSADETAVLNLAGNDVKLQEALLELLMVIRDAKPRPKEFPKDWDPRTKAALDNRLPNFCHFLLGRIR